MTNGDVIKDLFNPRDDQIKIYDDWVEIEIQRQGINFSCELRWWNALSKEKESATVAKFHDFYPEDHETWPPAVKEILVKNHIGDKFLAYLDYDDGEDGGWGFYSEDGEFIADIDEIDAWMPIPRHERDKNYIPIWEREKKTIPAETHEDMDESTEEEKGR